MSCAGQRQRPDLRRPGHLCVQQQSHQGWSQFSPGEKESAKSTSSPWHLDPCHCHPFSKHVLPALPQSWPCRPLPLVLQTWAEVSFFSSKMRTQLSWPLVHVIEWHHTAYETKRGSNPDPRVGLEAPTASMLLHLVSSPGLLRASSECHEYASLLLYPSVTSFLFPFPSQLLVFPDWILTSFMDNVSFPQPL